MVSLGSAGCLRILYSGQLYFDILSLVTDARAILCPYCGDRQVPAPHCRACGGLFDSWSLNATQNDMGAWFVRDADRPHFVGFRFEALVAAIRAGEIGRDAIVRGPSTRQLWTLARRAPGIAQYFGRCFACQSPMGQDDAACAACGASTTVEVDRNFFGLPPFEPIAPPHDAKPDRDAFVLDSGLLVVRAVPVRSPAQTVVRVSVGDFERATPEPGETAPTTRTSADPLSRSALSPTNHATNHAATHRPATDRSLLDRSLLDRSRRLERINRLLFGAAACGVAFTLLFGIAFVVQTDRRTAELAEARERALAEVRSEFAVSAPVVVPKPADLPPMPGTIPPAAGGASVAEDSLDDGTIKSSIPQANTSPRDPRRGVRRPGTNEMLMPQGP